MSSLRLALRRLLHAPGFSIVAIITLALGLGANTAIFSLVDGVLLRPLSFPQPQQLVTVETSIPEFAQKFPAFPVNARSYDVWRSQSKLLAAITILQPNAWVLSGSGQPRRVSGVTASAGLFQTLGIAPRLGRGFLASEDAPGKNHVVVISDAFWRAQFHADPNVIGQSVDLDGHPNLIVGVLPASAHLPHGAELGPFFSAGAGDQAIDVVQPLGRDTSHAPPVGQFNFLAIARMKPGVSATQ
ncbi:MAG: ABC transporter permease, partial [Terriglobales bacterium]